MRAIVFERRNLLRLVVGIAGLGIPGIAGAQAPQTTRIRADIDSVDADTLHLAARNGEKTTVRLTPDATVVAIVPIALADIKPGSFIGSAALPQPDGKLRALEVHVFPESMRGTGEGHRPFDLQPQSTMTNGTVGAVTGSTDRSLTVAYRGGEQTIIVSPETPVVTYEPGSRDMLTAGAHVIVTAAQDASGKLTATRIAVGKNGLVPPM